MLQDQITVIVPAYNEGEVIGSVVEGIRRILPGAELIVVNDGSDDGTGQAAEKAGARVLSHQYNLGYGASLKTGVAASRRDYVLFCDGDGQHDPADLVRLVERAGDYDMVVGSRDRNSHFSLARRPGKFILNQFARFLLKQRIPDLNSGLRIVRRDVINKYIHLMPEGFSFSTTSTFALLKSRYRIGYVPITVRKRTGKSTVRQGKHGFETIMLMLRLTVLFEPLRVFLPVSLVLFLLAVASFIITVCAEGRLQFGSSTILLGIATLIMFVFGLLCDQISALRREFHE